MLVYAIVQFLFSSVYVCVCVCLPARAIVSYHSLKSRRLYFYQHIYASLYVYVFRKTLVIISTCFLCDCLTNYIVRTTNIVT